MGCANCKVEGLLDVYKQKQQSRTTATDESQIYASSLPPGKKPVSDQGTATTPPQQTLPRKQPLVNRVFHDAAGEEAEGKHILEESRAPSYRVRKSIVNSRVKVGPPELIYEKYEFLDEILGTGISGSVRVARDKQSGREYAIKTLNLEGVSVKKGAMLHNEVEIYLKLDHPNIAKLIEVYEDPTKIQLVMELCRGKELYDRLSYKHRYNERDAAKVTVEMLEAINYCHQHRICHRDLKLENWVYVDSNEDSPLKLIDFGFSRIFNPVIPMTAMHGTVYYVGPEVMDGCYHEKCDIWSIGVIVYMLLSGSPPFNGPTVYDVLLQIKTANYNFDAPVWTSISEEAKDFVTKLLVKDPNQRYSAAQALVHPWLTNLQNTDTEANEIDISVLQAMREFALANVMKRAALGLVALSLTNQEVKDLYKEFKKFDKDKKGSIKLQELVSVLQESLKISQTEAQRVFERIDQTGDREVHYSEFLAATIQAKLLLRDSWIEEAFMKFDPEGKGVIDAESLRAVLGDVYNGVRVEDIIRMCDRRGTGQLRYDDFLQALTIPDYSINNVEDDDRCTRLEVQTSLSTAVASMATTQ